MFAMTTDTNRSTTSITAILIVTSLSSFIAPFLSSSVTVALPQIGHEFHLGAVALGWINMAYLLAAGVFLIPLGRLGDMYGRKRVFVSGIWVLCAATTMIALAGSETVLLAGRALQGFGSAMVFATATPILVSVVPAAKRGHAIGIVIAATYIGLSVGPFLGGILTQQLGWRSLFWFNLLITLSLLVTVYTLVKGEWADTRGEKYDTLGAVLLGSALLLTMYGLAHLPELLPTAMAAVGLLLLVMFVVMENRVSSPLVDIGLFRRSTVFSFSLLAALINYAATNAVTFLLSLYLQKVRGMSPQVAGFVLIAQPVVQAAVSPLAGRLSDRHEPRMIASFGMFVTLIGLVLLIFLGAASPILFLIGCLMLLGFGFGLFSSPNTNAIMSSVDHRALGLAGSILSAVRQTGMVLSMGITLMVIQILVGKVDIGTQNAEALISSMRIAFSVFAVLSAIGVWASLRRGTMHKS